MYKKCGKGEGKCSKSSKNNKKKIVSRRMQDLRKRASKEQNKWIDEENSDILEIKKYGGKIRFNKLKLDFTKIVKTNFQVYFNLYKYKENKIRDIVNQIAIGISQREMDYLQN